jgi:4-amino-4-deoxy-L-arabinose transferase-like glycosyltransferase
MAPEPHPREGDPAATGRTIGLAVAAAIVLLHTAVNLTSPYGFQRDEFLYFGMGQHLQFWRMDFPPFIAVVANLSRSVLGESAAALRSVSSLAAAAAAYLAISVARRLGGRTYAQALTALCLLTAPLFLRAGSLYQPVVFDQLWWTLGLYTLVRLQGSGDQRWWLALGAVGGLGLLTKFSIAFFGFGVFVALLLTPERRALATRGPWLALAIALVLGSPSLVGQARLAFPVVGQLHDLQGAQLARVSPLDFVLGQLLLTGPAFGIAVAGAVALLGSRRWAHLRVVGWTTVAAFATLLLLHGKAYYVGPIYPVLFALGAVGLERWADGAPRRWLRVAVVVPIVASGLLVAPIGLPFLPPARLEAYVRALGLTDAANRTNSGRLLRLPQDYADMLGWEDRVAAVARAYRALDPARRTQAVVLAGNWGEAGALDFFGPRHGLPGVVSPSGSYWFFGPGARPGAVVVAIGISEAGLRRHFDRVTAAEHLRNDWTVTEEQDLTIYVCEGPRSTLQALWPEWSGRN